MIVTRNIDRISSLPDPILVDILSLMALNDAVTTGVLSKRWMNLWTQVTTIFIHIRRSKGPFKYWTTFHKKILPKLTSPIIKRFCLELDCYISRYGLEQIDTWFSQASTRWNIEEIKVTMNGNEGLICFPVVFQIYSLVVLELHGDLFLNFPINEVNIPNLKKLSIQINLTQIKQCQLILTLIKSCPLLEELSLYYNYKFRKSGFLIPGEISLAGHNLKWLSISFSGQNLVKAIVIDCPNLIYLNLNSANNMPSFRFVSTPIMLAEAYIHGNIIRRGMTSNLFDAISRVKFLSIGRPMIGEMTRSFINLDRLICNLSFSGEESKSLLGLLERCPLLEIITINFTSFGKWDYLWLLSYAQPTFILTHVKRLEMHFMSSLMLNNDAMILVKYLLTNARVLDRLIIKITDPSDEKNEKEDNHEVEACKQIFDWARGSSSRYQVEFLGKYLRIVLSGEECKLIKGSNGYIISV